MTRDRYDSLQVLRCIAFSLIFISHSGLLLGGLGLLGAFGVSIFIIMSGFLSGLKYDAKKIKTLSFVKKRLVKIYPLHIATLLCAIPFSFVAIRVGEEKLFSFILKSLANLTLVQSYIPIKEYYFSLNAVSWYLTLVITFTFFTKPFLLFIEKIAQKKMGELIVLIIFFILILLLVLCCRRLSCNHWLIYINPLLRLLEYFFGITLGKLFLKIENRLKLHYKLLFITSFAFSAILIYLSIKSGQDNPLFYSVTWIIVSAMLVVVFYISESKSNFVLKFFMHNKCFVFLGNISMELFLIHQLVYRYLRVIIKNSNFLYVFLAFVISVISSFIWRILYSKIISMKSKKEVLI